jgi:hypothetical protein
MPKRRRLRKAAPYPPARTPSPRLECTEALVVEPGGRMSEPEPAPARPIKLALMARLMEEGLL